MNESALARLALLALTTIGHNTTTANCEGDDWARRQQLLSIARILESESGRETERKRARGLEWESGGAVALAVGCRNRCPRCQRVMNVVAVVCPLCNPRFDPLLLSASLASLLPLPLPLLLPQCLSRFYSLLIALLINLTILIKLDKCFVLLSF